MVAGDGDVEPELAGQILSARPREEQARAHAAPGREAPRAAKRGGGFVSLIEDGGGREQEAVVERGAG